MKRFFAYSECGFTFHDTAEKAKAEAERLLAVERDFATREGEWSDDALCIMWGEMRGRAEQHWMQTWTGEEYLEMTMDDTKQWLSTSTCTSLPPHATTKAGR